MVIINSANKAVIDEILTAMTGVRPGKMFGFPAYYSGKKLAICVFENIVGVKLPEERVKELISTDPHAAPFQPYGKHVMREWVQLSAADAQEYRQYQELFSESIAFVLKQQMEGK